MTHSDLLSTQKLIKRFRATIPSGAHVTLSHQQMRILCEFYETMVTLLEDQVALNCTVRDKYFHLDSNAISSNAEAMRLLAQLDRLEITHEYGRRVLARWRITDARAGVCA